MVGMGGWSANCSNQSWNKIRFEPEPGSVVGVGVALLILRFVVIVRPMPSPIEFVCPRGCHIDNGNKLSSSQRRLLPYVFRARGTFLLTS